MKAVMQHKGWPWIAVMALIGTVLLWHGQGGVPVGPPASAGTGLDAGELEPALSTRAPQLSPLPEKSSPGISRADAGFEQAADLFAYARSLSTGEQAGNADALWQASRVHEYCAPYAFNPAAYARDTRTLASLDLPTSPSLLAARERVSQRCARFAPSDELSSQAIVKRRQAADAGSLAAEAALLAAGQPLSGTNDYARDLVSRVLLSADPQAFVAIAPAMGLRASGDPDTWGEVSGDGLSELAWQLAACKLGLDCSSSGSLMTSYCVNGGICSRDASQDFSSFVLDAAVPRQAEERLNSLVNNLMAKSGDRE